jgi:hypothetical protein
MLYPEPYADETGLRFEIRDAFIVNYRIYGQKLVREIGLYAQAVIEGDPRFPDRIELALDVIAARFEDWSKEPAAFQGAEPETIGAEGVRFVSALVKSPLESHPQAGKTGVALEMEIEDRPAVQILETDKGFIYPGFDAGRQSEYYIQQHAI